MYYMYLRHEMCECVYCIKNKQVSVAIILPFVFIASRFCNVLSVSFPLHHNVPSLDSSPNSAPRWLMVWLLMFPLIEGITHRGIILSILIFIISLSLALLSFHFHFVSPKVPWLIPAFPLLKHPFPQLSSLSCARHSRNVKCYICMHINRAWRSQCPVSPRLSDSSAVSRKVRTGEGVGE